MSQASSTGAAFMADAYSFGVTIWEIFSGELPWAGLPPMQIAIIVTQENRLLEIPPQSPPEIQALLAACFERDPTLRPTMEKVEADFPEIDEIEIEPPAAAFTQEPAAYTLSSQFTLSTGTVETGVRTPQVRGGRAAGGALQHLRTSVASCRTHERSILHAVNPSFRGPLSLTGLSRSHIGVLTGLTTGRID